uniref:Si:dkey-166k12.1 n=1 Tax=Scleropages formosus TaxID=113540 RepID=A0A8C9TZ08_SCLFO
MRFDDLLSSVGGFGRYQKTLYVWICLPQVLIAFHMMASVFTGATPPHRCRDTWRHDNASGAPASACLARAPNGTARTCGAGWTYSREVFESTVVTEVDCTPDTLHFLQSHTHTPVRLSPPVLDRYGRRFALLASLALQTVFGVGTAFAPSFPLYVFLRFIVGAAVSGVIINAFVLGTEWTCTRHRMLAGIITDYFFGLGYMLLAGVAYLVRDWRKLQLAISAPGFLFIFYIWVLPHSARWLLANDRRDEAIVLLRRAAAVNGKDFPSTKFEILPEQRRSHTAVDLVRTPQMRKRAIILFYIWFVNVLVYYGLSLGVSHLGVNLYLTQFVFGVVEIPARSLVMLFLPCSRRLPQSAFLAVGGAACLLTLAVPAGERWGRPAAA